MSEDGTGPSALASRVRMWTATAKRLLVDMGLGAKV
jgi:hypothetical protein